MQRYTSHSRALDGIGSSLGSRAATLLQLAWAARLGMREEAHLVQNVWFKGEWSDELDFALLEVEWREQRLLGCPRCLNGDGQPFGTPTSPDTAR
jgi:hypothetical protein